MTTNPYAYALGDRDPREVIAETPARLRAAVASMTEEAANAAPAPGKWSVREVVAHIADCELAFGFRLRQVYGGEGLIQPFDQDAWARSYGVYSMEQALATFAALRAWNVSFVDGLTEDDKKLAANHPERGEMMLWTVVQTMAGHDLHHLAKLEGSGARV